MIADGVRAAPWSFTSAEPIGRGMQRTRAAEILRKLRLKPAEWSSGPNAWLVEAVGDPAP